MTRKPSLYKRVLPSPSLSVMVVVFWLLMSDSFTVGQIVLGMILGVVVPLFAARLDREFARIGSLRPLPKLLFVTLWDILISNIRVAIQVLGPERRIHPGFIWVPLEIRDLHGITALTSIISLTPGTLSTELTPDRRFLLVHCFDLKDAETTISEIKSRYEAPLREIFE